MFHERAILVRDCLMAMVAVLPIGPMKRMAKSGSRPLRGLEMAKHQTFTVATKVKVYFSDPPSPSQCPASDKRLPTQDD
jgi:hypothetical protein